MAYDLQNFYKQTLLLDWSIGTGNFYVSTKPTISAGWLVISPNNSTIREIIKYIATGTDANGDYITVSVRGVGGTTEQAHTAGEPIRMNITAEYWDDMNDQIAAIVASGVPNANTTTMGGVEIATNAEMIAGTDIGSTGASVVPTPSIINARIASLVANNIQTFTSNGTWTKPSVGTHAIIECWGGGGSGGKNQGAGGGGGNYTKRIVPLSSLGTTETVTIGVGGGAKSSNGAGDAGGNTTFGSLLTAYGGGGGTGNGGTGVGGGGAGALGAGSSGQGGSPALAATAGLANTGFGGGNGGDSSTTAVGGLSYGGGGGGGAAAGAGGASYLGGGGGGGYTAGAGGVSVLAGAGGAGVSAGAGGIAGTLPGGGGGGTNTGTASGAGAGGKCVVTVF